MVACRLLAALALSGCALSHAGLRPGVATRQDVLGVLGPPAMQWANPDGSSQLSYPSGPSGYESRMVYLDAGGRLVRIDYVTRDEILDTIVAGMSEADVVRRIGPPVPEWTANFDARNERALEWRYCSDHSEIARFDVLIDRDRNTVRSSMRITEDCGRGVCYCGHSS